MITNPTLRALLILAAPVFATVPMVAAAEQATATTQPALIEPNRPIFFVGEKLWAATWDVPMIDALVVVPGPALKTEHHSSLSDTEILPITSAGIQYKDINLSFSYLANSSFAPVDDTSTTVSRKEWDVALGYAIFPNLTASIAYKKGTIDQVMTSNARALIGASTGYTVEGLLVGLSASAPLQGPLSLYGNMAYGPAKEKVNGGTMLGSPTFNGNYKIGEIGLSYRFAGASGSGFLKNLTAQMGYRAQIVSLRDIDFPTYSIPPGATPVSSQKTNMKTTTDGFVLGIVAAF